MLQSRSYKQSSMSNTIFDVLVFLRVALHPATYGVQIHTYTLLEARC
jgi:hypothetical protein